jgi:pimeloyl-ACP methyl ester carboxylesterase
LVIYRSQADGTTMMDARKTSKTVNNPTVHPRAAAEPVTFDGCVGLFTPPSSAASPSGLAVLFASPWGLEEMCTRKFWRIIAEKLADLGIPSLRFDYPGTGDGLDGIDFSGGLSVWSESLVTASQRLRLLSGCERIVVVAQGLGAVVATKAASGIEGLEGITFMAPVVSGRLHVRELAIWSRVVDENLGLTEDQRARAGVSIASFTMPDEVADELRKVNLMMIEQPPAQRVLMVGRRDRPADRDFATRLQALGADVSEQVFEGYEQLVSNPATSKLPISVADELSEWIAALPVEPNSLREPQRLAPEPLLGADFRETPVRFGLGDHLSGVLCEPLHERAGATVLFLTSAYDRHAGWGRTTVSMARTLARSGIPSLRFDTANAGDSPAFPGRPAQVLYDNSQTGDVSAALDFLEARRLVPVVAAGRCSGAYLAFQAALVEPRLSGIIAVNPAVFRWRPGRSVEDAIVNGTRSLQDYGRRAFSGETLKRLLKGDIDILAAGRNIIRGTAGRIRNRLLHVFRHLLPEGQVIYGAFRTLHQRGLPVSLIYSEADLGLEQYSFYFGHDGAGLARFGNVSCAIIPDADHNLTPDHSRAVYLAALREMAFKLLPERQKSSKSLRAIAAE